MVNEAENDTFYIGKKNKFTHDVSKDFVFEIVENINIKLFFPFTKASTDTLIPLYSRSFTKMHHHVIILWM